MPNDLEAASQGVPQGEPVPEVIDNAPVETTEPANSESPAPAEGTAVPEAPEAEPNSPPKGAQKRIDELTALRYQEKRRADAAEAERAALLAELGALRGANPDPSAPALKPVYLAPEQIRKEAEKLRAAEKFDEACNRTFEAGTKEFQDFTSARDSLVGAFGNVLQQRPDFLEAITELPDGHKVFHHLGKNLDEANRVLSLPPVKMALELSKLSAEVAKLVKPVSSAPVPIKPIDASGTRAETDPDKMNDQEFDKWFAEKMANRRRR